MHVLLTPSWYPTPDNPTIGTFFREQAHALSDAGLCVGVVTPQLQSLWCRPDAVFHWPKGVRHGDDEGVPTYSYHGWAWLPKFPRGNARLWIRAGRRLFDRYVSNHGMPDLIHAHGTLCGGVLAAQIKRCCRVPYVVTEHSSYFARKMVKPWQIPLAKEAVAHADARMVVSPQLGQLLEARFGDVMCPWTWVPNMVADGFRPADTTAANDDDPCFRFLNIGFLNDNKGQADLLQAMARAFRGDHTVQLRIGGDGPCMGQLVDLAERLGIRDQVAFLGRLERRAVLAEMQSCDAFVLSSHYETFGVAVVEALACGKPVIATRCGGPECILGDHNGRLVPMRCVDSLTQAMIEMRREIGQYDPELIRRDCLARFGQEAVVRQLCRIYEDVVGQTRVFPAGKERAA